MNNKINRRTTNIFLKAEELFTELERQVRLLKSDQTVDIATYSFYLNITTYDIKKRYGYNSPARQFIDTINSRNLKHRVIVGAPYLLDKLAHMPEYIEIQNQSVERDKLTIKLLRLNARVHQSLHLKYYRIGDRIWIGGINLTSSDWIDVAHEVIDEHDKQVLMEIFDNAWNEASSDIDQYKK